MLAAIKRILEAEAAASGAPKPPDYSVLSEYPVTRNDEAATRKVVAALERQFGTDRVHEIEPATASEDFGLFGAAWDVPAVFWVVGGIDPDKFKAAEQAGKLDEIPANHAPDFAPVIDPTLRTGIEAMLAAAGAWLATGAGEALTGIEPAVLLVRVLDLVGTFVFAISGAALGVQRGMDLFGVLVLAFVTAVVGGITRDVLIGAVPPASDRELAQPGPGRRGRAAGLSLLRAVRPVAAPGPVLRCGRARGLRRGRDPEGAGSRDQLADGGHPGHDQRHRRRHGARCPDGAGADRLRSDIYAVAALAGALVVVAGNEVGLPPTAVALAGIALCVFLRLMALYRGWKLPVATSGGDRAERNGHASAHDSRIDPLFSRSYSSRSVEWRGLFIGCRAHFDLRNACVREGTTAFETGRKVAERQWWARSRTSASGQPSGSNPRQRAMPSH